MARERTSFIPSLHLFVRSFSRRFISVSGSSTYLCKKNSRMKCVKSTYTSSLSDMHKVDFNYIKYKA
jgi:hypothetical protein